MLFLDRICFCWLYSGSLHITLSVCRRNAERKRVSNANSRLSGGMSNRHIFFSTDPELQCSWPASQASAAAIV